MSHVMTMSSRALQWKSRNNRNPNFYLSKKDRRRMERYFGNAYRGDPGVPHADADRFVNIWVGSAAFGVLTFFDPYMWQLSNQFSWHDKAMLYEHYHWKQAKKKNQPYKFKWNEYMDKEERDSYYFNWPLYFP